MTKLPGSSDKNGRETDLGRRSNILYCTYFSHPIVIGHFRGFHKYLIEVLQMAFDFIPCG